ncbi:MAG: (2Fe-2S)-binding protein [Nitrospiraceae bacterium]
MYVCLCKGLTETDVQSAAQEGNLAPEKLIAALRLDDDDCCGRCARNIQELITCGSVVCGSRETRVHVAKGRSR